MAPITEHETTARVDFATEDETAYLSGAAMGELLGSRDVVHYLSMNRRPELLRKIKRAIPVLPVVANFPSELEQKARAIQAANRAAGRTTKIKECRRRVRQMDRKPVKQDTEAAYSL